MPDFTYEAGGKTVSLPHVEEIPYGTLRKIRKLPGDEQDDALLEAIASPETLEVIDSLTIGEVAKLMAAWQEASEVGAGESSASTTS
jgi:hypothetical protein